MSWEKFLSHGESRFDAEVEARLQAIQRSDVGCLIYTSGTTGPPKAVQISHGALAGGASLIPQVWNVTQDDVILSYLPLAHIAERMITVHFQANFGNTVYFARSLQELAQHLNEVRPTVFFGVPRVFEKMEDAARLKIEGTKGLKGKLARWAVRTGQNWHRFEQRGKRAPLKTALAKSAAVSAA